MLKKRKTAKTGMMICVAASIVLAGAGAYWLWQRHSQRYAAQTTSTSPTAQDDYTGGANRESNPSTDTNQGGATDNNGDSAATGTSGISSDSGVVTVVSPATNDTLATGTTLRGTATGVDKVQYRLIDDDSGVIAQGTLSVVNGTFSGTLHFKSHAATGRLDVYTYSAAYEEINQVQLPVRFGS